ncbi:LacI family transcriptional regulator [Micrococcales bacterium KH10]|nr:LacI family transcriptional regulator [Micrococcales bacterium KH10]
MSTPTIGDVAREAGVSTATVSRALSGSLRVSGATARRVRETATRLGYSGNPIARALRKNATGNVGVLVPSVSNPFFTMLVDEIEKHMVTMGINLYLCTSRDDHDVEAARLASLTQGSVDGILVSPCDAARSGAALAAAQTKLPVVQLDRSADGVDIDWVGLDDADAMRTIIEHLASRGVKRAALVTSSARNSSGRLRTAFAVAAGTQHGITLDSDQIFDGEFSTGWGTEAATRLVSQGDLPDAIICTDDQIAIGVMQELKRQGIRVPGDVLVTGLDDVPHATLIDPPLTTVRQPVGDIAATAVDLLATKLRGEERSIRKISLQGTLVERESTAN